MERAWQFVPYNGVRLRQDDDAGLIVESETTKHFYVPYGRADTNFRTAPIEASFDLAVEHHYDFVVEVQTEGDIETQLALVEYTPSGDRVLMGSETSLKYIPSSDATSASIALRLKGTGSVSIGQLSIHSDRVTPIEDLEWSHPVTELTHVTVRIGAFSQPAGASKAALTVVKFVDQNGDSVLPSPDLPIHPRLGAYSYVTCEDEAQTVISTKVPGRATEIRIKGRSWKRDTEVFMTGAPQIQVETVSMAHAGSERESIAEFVQKIPENANFIVLYTTAPLLGHETLSLRPNRLAAEYLDLGAWVVFFPFSRVPVGSEYVSPRCRQYSLDDLHDFLHHASRRTGPNNVFICSSFPNLGAITAVDLLRSRRWETVYEVRDDMEEFNRVGYSKWFHPRLESRIAKTVNTIVAVSPRLAYKMNTLRGEDAAVVVPNAVSSELANKGAPLRTSVVAHQRSSSTVVGYIGHLTPSWFDWDGLIQAAESLPDVSFEIIGHGAPSDLSLPVNVLSLGPKTHDEFLEIAKRWKVGLIPFRSSTLTSAVDPNKIYEYLAVGLRVVTARMGSVEQCPSTWIYDDADDLPRLVSDALSQDYADDELDVINSFVSHSLWPERARVMYKLMGLST